MFLEIRGRIGNYHVNLRSDVFKNVLSIVMKWVLNVIGWNVQGVESIVRHNSQQQNEFCLCWEVTFVPISGRFDTLEILVSRIGLHCTVCL